MQASPAWTPPGGTLGAIVAEARQRASALRPHRADLMAKARETVVDRDIVRALTGEHVAVIAEVKRRSPSKGWINANLSSGDQAAAYEQGGAAAISVLTEPAHFGGSNDDLAAVRAAVRVPVLKKDFHVEPIQLIEAKALGASAALLIARALSPDDLARMIAFAGDVGLPVLVEVRDDGELERSVAAGARIVGVNNRNLETLVIDPATAERVVHAIPADLIAIAESGVQSAADVARYARAGADAVLVGSVVSAAADPFDAVAALAAVPRIGRGH